MRSTYIVDEHLASILNKDNMVQIDKWIFKLDLKNKKCYVLPLIDVTEILLKSMKYSVPTGDKIKTYSTEEDVLDLLAEGKPSQASEAKNKRVNGLFGNDAKLDYYVYYDESAGNLFDNDQRGKIECKVVYQKAGVYFSLQAKVKYHQKINDVYIERPASLCIDYHVIKFESKRNSIGNKDYSDRATDCDFKSEVSHRPYENIRGLWKYWFEVTFSIAGTGSTGGGSAVYVRNFGVKDVY